VSCGTSPGRSASDKPLLQARGRRGNATVSPMADGLRMTPSECETGRDGEYSVSAFRLPTASGRCRRKEDRASPDGAGGTVGSCSNFRRKESQGVA